jgi:hypothetical protein
MAQYHRPLQQYIDADVAILVECRRCGHRAKFKAAELAARWGRRVDPWQLPFRCHNRANPGGRRCLSRRVSVYPDWSVQQKVGADLQDSGRELSPSPATIERMLMSERWLE